jgi:hypothetical protein
MQVKGALGIALLVSACLTSGCAGLRVRPDAGSVTVPKANRTMRVAVGIMKTEQKVSGGLIAENFPDLGPIFRKHLEESGLFQNVSYPTRPTDQVVGQITLHVDSRFQSDGALFPKAILTGFLIFLPTPLIWYNHEYQSECTLDVMRGGRTLKSYTTKAVVVASHKLFAPADVLEADGTEAVSKLLCARLIEQLQKDQLFLEKEFAAPHAAAVD